MDVRIFLKYLMKGQFNELQAYLNDYLTSIDPDSYEYYKIILFQIYALLAEANYTRAKQILNTIKTKINEMPQVELQMYYYTLLGRYYYRTGNLSLAEQNLNKACELYKQHKASLPYPHDTLILAEITNLKGLIGIENGNLATALDYLMKSYRLRKKLNDKYALVNSLNNLGIIYLSLGQYENSRMYFDNALKIAQKIEYSNGEIMILNNLGVLYQTTGELDKSLQYHELALQRKVETDNKIDLDLSFYNIARIFEQKGLYAEAENYFHKCLELQKKAPKQNPIKIVKTLYRLTLLSLHHGELEQANSYLQKIGNYVNSDTAFSIQYRYRLAKAIYYTAHNDKTSKFKGLKLLEDILNEKMIEKDFTIQAQLYYVETLFELLLIGDIEYMTEQEIFNKIEYILGELNYFYQTQNAYQVLVETLLLQAKFYFIKNNLQRAQFILDQAWISAIEFGFTSLIRKIEEEREILKIQELQPITVSETIDAVKKRIAQSKILNYLEELKKTI